MGRNLVTLHPNTRLMLEIYAERHPDTGYIPDPRQMKMELRAC